MKGENTEKNAPPAGRTRLARIVLPRFSFILMLLLIGVAGALILIKAHAPAPADPVREADSHFSSCRLLAAGCTDAVACSYNIYCGDGFFADCRVYDCTDHYGVATLDAAGKADFKEVARADEAAIATTEDRCSGTVRILSQSCQAGKTEIKLRLDTKGECAIESFAIIFDQSGVQPSSFSALGDGSYQITAYACGKLKQIIPAAQGGIGLELPMLGA